MRVFSTTQIMNCRSHILVRATLLLVVGLFMSGCATRVALNDPISDPFEPVNRAVFSFNDKVDRWALKPVATGYKKITPSFVRIGVNNFFGNLGDVSTAANGLLQGKIKQGLSDTARVAVNTVPFSDLRPCAVLWDYLVTAE